MPKFKEDQYGLETSNNGFYFNYTDVHINSIKIKNMFDICLDCKIELRPRKDVRASFNSFSSDIYYFHVRSNNE